MLKKQTVWLLTMLSLMIVLSVYYIIGGNDDNDLAFIDNGQSDLEQSVTTDSDVETNEDGAEVTDIANATKDEIFSSIRMDLEDERSMKVGRLKDVVAASGTSADEKSQAMKDIDLIESTTTKEKILEDTILNQADYEDVLIRLDNEKVHVHVMVNELSVTEADNIMQMVRDEFGDDITTEVNFQPSKEKE